jgi:hypothetical protein
VTDDQQRREEDTTADAVDRRVPDAVQASVAKSGLQIGGTVITFYTRRTQTARKPEPSSSN